MFSFLIGVVVLIVLWVAWSMWRHSVVKKTQFHFACMVDAMEEGDRDTAAISGRVFNDLSNNAMSRLDHDELVKRMYVKKDDMIRLMKISEDSDGLTTEVGFVENQ